MSEKRRFLRFNVLMDAICRKSNSEKKVKINNFSREGIGVLSSDPFSMGDGVETEFTIPGDNIPIVIKGEVTWCSSSDSDNSQYKGGIKFTEINNQDRARILEHIYKKWIIPEGTGVK